jgi:hypothetical protein
MEMGKFDFGFSKTPINQTKHPLISKLLIDKSDDIESGAVHALIWELLSLPTVTHRNVQFDFVNNTK